MDTLNAGKIETSPCIQCGVDQQTVPQCNSCGALTELPPKVTYFEALGLAPRFSHKSEALQQAFHRANKLFHPDRYSNRSEEEKNCSLAWSSLANTAYRALKEDRSRAAYLLGILGFVLSEEERKKVPVEIAEEYFETQEALADGDPGEIEKMESVLNDLRRMNDTRLLALYEKADEGLEEGSANADVLKSIALKLNERNYLETMLADLRERADAVG